MTEEFTQVPANLSMLLISMANVPYFIDGEYGSGEDIIEGDIKMTPEQAAIFKSGGWKELVNSEAWLRNHGKWSRNIPYNVSGVG